MATKVEFCAGSIDGKPEDESSHGPILQMLSEPPEEEVEGQFFYSGWTHVLIASKSVGQPDSTAKR